MNLLMVNDAVLELESMEKKIAWDNYGITKVFTAKSAFDARNILMADQIDILLCDIEMPGEDGISLIRWIRQNNYDIDCILLTCHSDFAYAKEAITLNCREYILLPTKYEEIGLTVQKTVNQRLEHLRVIQYQEYGKNWVKTQADTLSLKADISPKETVENCASYILQNLNDEELSVSDIAAHFHLNAIYLNRIFKKEKGISLSQWLIQELMKLAAQLLENPQYTAVAVANHVGYPNYPYFSTVFKKYYGCTPAQYSARHAGK